jgi:dienelactone hydrolase
MTSDVRDMVIRLDDQDHGALLGVPPDARGLVIFAHGSGSSRFSRRNNYVAEVLRERGIGTLLFDLLTEAEDRTYENRFDIPLLTRRLVAATRWVRQQAELKDLAIGYFGASTGAAAALQAAAESTIDIAAVVSRGGRPDLAGEALRAVRAPVLLIVGSHDDVVIDLNRQAAAQMQCEWSLEIVPGATHLFEEPGTLEQAASLAADWFVRHLSGAAPKKSG